MTDSTAMADWQRRGLDVPDLSPTSAKTAPVLLELQTQNQSLRNEIARLKIGGLNGGAEPSRMELFKLKDEVNELKARNAELMGLLNPGKQRQLALKRMTKIMEAWLAGTSRGDRN